MAFKYSKLNTSLLGIPSLSGTASGIWGDGNYIYATGYSSNILRAYKFISEYGASATSNIITLSDVGGKLHGDGDYIYVPVNSYGVSAFTFNGSVLTSVGGIATPSNVNRVVNCDGTYVYVGGHNYLGAYTFDGSSFSLVTSSDEYSINEMESDANGNIHLATSAGYYIYKTNPDTNSFDYITSSNDAENFVGLSLTEYNQDGIYIHTNINPSTGICGLRGYKFDGSNLEIAVSAALQTGNDYITTVQSDGQDVWTCGVFSAVQVHRVVTSASGGVNGRVYERQVIDGTTDISYDACLQHGYIYFAAGEDGIATYRNNAVKFVMANGGLGTSASSDDPINTDQLEQYTIYKSPILGVSASSDLETIRISGTSVTLYGNEFATYYGNVNFTSYEDGTPWAASATNGNFVPSFDVFEFYNGAAPFGTKSIKNAILYGANVAGESNELVDVSGTVNFYNSIIYHQVNIDEVDQIEVHFYGCTIVSADIDMYEYEPFGIENNNITTFNDTLFIDNTYSDHNESYGSIIFNSCIFTQSMAVVSAGMSSTYSAGTLEFNDCIFEQNLPTSFPEFEDVAGTNLETLYATRDLHVETYDLPITSAARTSAWTVSGYNTGFFNTPRTSVGAFSFSALPIPLPNISATEGHIGAFYFGFVDTIVETSRLVISATMKQPTVTTTTTVNTTVNPNTPSMTISVPPPKIYSYGTYDMDFVGTPRAGTSPLIVDFQAIVNFTGSFSERYNISEYRWYFDFDNNPTVYETSTIPTISHTYTGFAGKAFTVKLCVIVRTRS